MVSGLLDIVYNINLENYISQVSKCRCLRLSLQHRTARSKGFLFTGEIGVGFTILSYEEATKEVELGT